MITKATISIGPKEDAIIRVAWQFTMMTADQVCRLLYQPTDIEYVRRRLKLLTEAGYLARKVIPRSTQHGSSPFLYALGRKGVAYLREVGQEVSYFPSDHDPHFLFIQHGLAVNELLIAASLLRSVPVVELRTESQLKKTPLRVQLEQEQIAVIPDAFIDWGRVQVCLELDRDTEEAKKIRRKVRGYIGAISKGEYQRTFTRTAFPTVAFVATSGVGRALTLRRWAEEELDALDARKYRQLFVFTDLPATPPNPDELYLARRWYEPYRAEPVVLLQADL